MRPTLWQDSARAFGPPLAASPGPGHRCNLVGQRGQSRHVSGRRPGGPGAEPGDRREVRGRPDPGARRVGLGAASNAVNQVRDAAEAFLDALSNTGSTARVTQFAHRSAEQLAPSTVVDDAVARAGRRRCGRRSPATTTPGHPGRPASTSCVHQRQPAGSRTTTHEQQPVHQLGPGRWTRPRDTTPEPGRLRDRRRPDGVRLDKAGDPWRRRAASRHPVRHQQRGQPRP